MLAHQGGWDEVLMVLIPIAAFVGLLWLATRRAKAIQAQRLATPPSEAVAPDADPDPDGTALTPGPDDTTTATPADRAPR